MTVVVLCTIVEYRDRVYFFFLIVFVLFYKQKSIW